VAWVDQAPRLGNVTNLTIFENVTTNVATIRVFDVDTAWTNLSLTATSTNTGIAGVAITATNASTQTNILVGTNAVDFTLKFTPVTNVFGTTAIRLVASDGQKTTTNQFTLTVKPVDQPPSYTLSTNLVLVGENAGALTITNLLTSLSAGPTNESNQT